MEELAKCQLGLAKWALTADGQGLIVEINRIKKEEKKMGRRSSAFRLWILGAGLAGLILSLWGWKQLDFHTQPPTPDPAPPPASDAFLFGSSSAASFEPPPFIGSHSFWY